jgi:anti-sigma B factor antagonist
VHTSDRTPLDHPVELSLAEARLADGGALLTVAGELDIATVPVVRERLTAITAAGARRLVVDLRAVSFMDSTALAAFIHAKMRLGDEGTMTLVLARDSYARLIFEVAGIDGVLDVVETLDG